MKKRLLITSIVMMLVVAVALSTATYAWFTSNDQVTANTVSLTAATSTQSAIGIAWHAPAGNVETNTPAWNANYGTEISPYDSFGAIQPAAPAFLDGQATLPTFNTAYITSLGTFKGDGTATSVYRMSNYANQAAATTASADFYDTIHIANLAQTGGEAKSIYMTATITGELVAIDATDNEGSGETVDTTNYNYYNTSKVLYTPDTQYVTSGYKEKKNDGIDLIRIAVFAKTDPSTYLFKGCLSQAGNGTTKDTAVGAIGQGNSAAALVSSTGYASTTELNLGSIAAQTEKEYVVFIWMDGQALDESQSGKKAEIKLNFTTSGSALEINS